MSANVWTVAFASANGTSKNPFISGEATFTSTTDAFEFLAEKIMAGCAAWTMVEEAVVVEVDAWTANRRAAREADRLAIIAARDEDAARADADRAATAKARLDAQMKRHRAAY